MPRIQVHNVGTLGLVADPPASDLPPEAWTYLLNARTTKHGIEKVGGDAATLGTSSSGTPSGAAIQPYWLLFAQGPSAGYWLLFGQQKIYVRESASPFVETNITRQSAGVDVNYSATEDLKWNASMYGGVCIANNGVDVPQFWAALSPSTKMANLTAWDANRRAKVLRPYGRFLVALDLTISGTNYPHDVLWSHPADAGSVPNSWDETDTTKDTGRHSLSDSQGFIVDGLGMRDGFIIYKEDAVWLMQRTNNAFIMRFQRLFDTPGLLTKDCVVPFKGNSEMHFVVGQDDVYVHNGQSAESVINDKYRKALFNAMDGAYYHRSFCVSYPLRREVWFCFPESGYNQPTQALIWNWDSNTFSMRDLYKLPTNALTRDTIAKRGVMCIAAGIVSHSTAASWDGDSASWDSDETSWDSREYSPLIRQLVAAERSGSKILYRMDQNTTFDTLDITTVFERKSLSIIGRDREGRPKNDNEVIKLVTELWPRFEGAAGTQISIYVGMQMSPNEAVSWGAPHTFIIGQDKKINPYVSGRFISLRFVVAGGEPVRLIDYELQLEVAGLY
jgi:hypothetical protein